MAALTETILGSVLITPEILPSLEIDKAFFQSQKERLVFAQIEKGIFDVNLIADNLKRYEGITIFLSKIQDGVPKTRPERLHQLINQVKKERKQTEVLKLINPGARSGFFDHEKIRSLYQEIGRLEAQESSLPLIPLNTVEQRPISWLWYNRLPLGAFNLMVGDPGDGKSLIALKMSAIVTNGAEWPDVKNSETKERSSVILLTAEDDLSTTVSVRAEVLGADLKKLFVFPNLVGKNQAEFFCLSKHLSLLERAIRETKNVRLVIFDPLAAYLGSIESNKVTQVRSALGLLTNLAEKYNVAIIGVHHLNKDSAKKALYRALGSVAFIAAARTVWLVHRDDEDPTQRRRFFSPLKTNICKNPTTLAFTIDGPIGKPNIEFESEPVEVDPNELLANEEGKDRFSASREAKEFLYEVLKDGPVSANEIYRQADENHISRRTLKRVKSSIGVHVYQRNREWLWEGELR